MIKMVSMLGGLISDAIQSWLAKIIDFITGFFAIIPQSIYFIYTCAASFLDLLQYIIRKLAGLDVYYVNGEATSGDIVTSFIKGILGFDKSEQYSSLSTVFWSMIIFGCMLLVIMTIFAIIKAHYNTDYKKTNPTTIIFESLRSLAMMAIVPFVTIFGLSFCNVILQGLDEATSYNSSFSSVFESGAISKFAYGTAGTRETSDEKDTTNRAYASYDFFGSAAFTNSTTFSGALFKVAANGCNRLRTKSYTPSSSENCDNWSNFGVFYSSKSGDEQREAVAEQIDYAFACDLRLVTPANAEIKGEAWALSSSIGNAVSKVFAFGLINVSNFSKYNVGLVWYYYNLWGFNLFIAAAGIWIFLTLLGNIVFGLITRMIQLLAMFFIFPPLIGIAPLDGGNAFKKWSQQYIGDVLMTFGAIVGMNLFFLILPFINSISFFNISFVDAIMNLVIMLAALTMVKNFIGMISGFIGASDANKIGEETKGAVAAVGQKALGTTLKAANVGVKEAKLIVGGFTGGLKAIRNAYNNSDTGKKNAQKKAEKQQAIKEILNSDDYDGTKINDLTDLGMSKRKAKALVKSTSPAAVNKAKQAAEDKQIKSIIKDSKMTADEKKAKIAEIKGDKYNEADVDKDLKKERNKGLVAAGFAAALGGKVEHRADGSVDAGATVSGTFQAFGQSVLDISSLGFNSILGGGALTKKLKSKDVGIGDDVRNIVSSLGLHELNNQKFMETEKSKEDRIRDESSRSAARDSAAISDAAANTKLMKDEITALANLIKNSKT